MQSSAKTELKNLVQYAVMQFIFFDMHQSWTIFTKAENIYITALMEGKSDYIFLCSHRAT